MAGQKKKSGWSKKTSRPKKPPLTHFLCVPLVTDASRPQLELSLQNFCEDVTAPSHSEAVKVVPTKEKDTESSARESNMTYIHPKAVRPVGALHCTLGVMSLDSEKLAEVIRFLESLDLSSILRDAPNQTQKATETPDTASIVQGATQSSPLSINLKGLRSMHPQQKTSILYAEPLDPTDRLYPFCSTIQKMFKEKGFLVDEDRRLKLHATVVNTIYAKGKKGASSHGSNARRGPSHSELGDATTDDASAGAFEDRPQGHGPNANAPLKMDATNLLARYKDHVWAEGIMLNRLAICEMGAKKILDEQGRIISEEYTAVAGVALPTS